MDKLKNTNSAEADYSLDDPKIINGWAFFDWANSVFPLVITVAIFPPYFMSVVDDEFTFFGFDMTNSALYSFAVSIGFLLTAISIPLLSGVADFGGKRKWFMKAFTYTGAIACISLFFFEDMSDLSVGTISFIVGMLGFAGGMVFYNAYLPLIVSAEKFDFVSAKGYSFGYFGSVILLILNLLTITFYEELGLPSQAFAVRLAFVMVGLWWFGFAQIPFARLPKDSPSPFYGKMLLHGFNEVLQVFKKLLHLKSTLIFLVSFFFYNAGVQTILYTAGAFAEKEFNFEATELIYLILILQVIAIPGSQIFAWLSKKRGNKFAIFSFLVIWAILCLAVAVLSTKIHFYVLGGLVGFVMGGTQAISRSTYAKLLPEGTVDTTSYFSFYDIVDKISTTLGTFIFGLLQLAIGLTNGIIALAAFFILGGIALIFVKMKNKKTVLA